MDKTEELKTFEVEHVVVHRFTDRIKARSADEARALAYRRANVSRPKEVTWSATKTEEK